MKHFKILRTTGTLLIAAITLMSCKKDQSLINRIEGTYIIEKLVYKVNSGDSVVSKPNSTMFFDYCKLRDQVAQQCGGYYDIEGQSRISFDYLPSKEGSKENMRINIGDFGLKPYFGGSYIIEDRRDEGFTLARYTFDTNLEKVFDLRIFLKK